MMTIKTMTVDTSDEASVRKAIAELEQLLPQDDQEFFDREISFEDFSLFARIHRQKQDHIEKLWLFAVKTLNAAYSAEHCPSYHEAKLYYFGVKLFVGDFCGETQRVKFQLRYSSTNNTYIPALFDLFRTHLNPTAKQTPDGWLPPNAR